MKQKRNKTIGFDPENEVSALEAVKQDGLALQYVREQTPTVCMEAVKQDGLALQYVKNVVMVLDYYNSQKSAFIAKKMEI